MKCKWQWFSNNCFTFGFCSLVLSASIEGISLKFSSYLCSMILTFAVWLLLDLCFVIRLGKFGMWSHATLSSSLQLDQKIYIQNEVWFTRWSPVISISYWNSKTPAIWIPWLYVFHLDSLNTALPADLLYTCLLCLSKPGPYSSQLLIFIVVNQLQFSICMPWFDKYITRQKHLYFYVFCAQHEQFFLLLQPHQKLFHASSIVILTVFSSLLHVAHK